MPQLKAQHHVHPRNSNATVYGYRLQPGDTIDEHDVYDSSSGTWAIAPCPGCKLGEGVAAIWVRPKTILNSNMRVE